MSGPLLEQDPIFQAVEPKERASRATVLVWQFFLFPLLVVAAAVGVFVFFGAIGASQRTPVELLADLRSGGENQQKQAAQQLAHAIADERVRADRDAEAGKEGAARPFYADPAFREGIHDALRTALADADASDARREWLAIALGRIAPPAPSAEGRAIAADLLRMLYPEPSPTGAPGTPLPGNVRLAAARALKDMESRDAEEALVRAASDRDDPEVRVNAVNGLALLGLPKHGGAAADGPRTVATLEERLSDPYAGVRLNAAVALGLRGNEKARPLLLRSLDDAELSSLGVTDPALRQSQKANAVRAAVALGGADLRAAVERLASPDHESDVAIRRHAATALERWRVE